MTTPRLDVTRFPHRTVPALLWATAERVPDRTFLRDLQHDERGPTERLISYSAFQRSIRAAAAWLRAQEVGPGDRVLLFAENSPEWQIFAIATTLLGAEPAAAFANLQAAPVRDILTRVQPKVIFVSTRAQWEKLGAEARPHAVVSVVSVVQAQAQRLPRTLVG